MGFALTIVYVVLTIISPGQFGVEFASYHPMFYLAALTAVASLPELFSRLSGWPLVQTQLSVLFVMAIVVSQLRNGMLAASGSLMTTLPAAVVFFFVVVNVNSLRRLKIMIFVMIATCVGIAIESFCGYFGGFGDGIFVLLQYGTIRRLRAAGFLNDPNDFAQFILIVLPLMFVAWQRGRIFLNSLVLAGAGFLLWAVYLTHSRGALIALGVLVIASFYKKIGAVPSAVLAGLFVLGMLALDFTGGRGISAADGSDRLELWSEGLELFKKAPIFGIGFGEFADSDFAGITAHNSFILCLAELGIVGSTIFVGMLVTTFMGLNKLIRSPESASQLALSEPPESEDCDPAELSLMMDHREELQAIREISHGGAELVADAATSEVDREIQVRGDPESELRPLFIGMRLALISFITTSWFLSRSYTATMFLLLGLATATITLREETSEADDFNKQALATLVVEFAAVVFVYMAVRFRV